MISYTLPTTVTIGGKEYAIENRCEHRVILDVIEALEDTEENQQFNMYCAMIIFFEDCSDLPNPLYANSAEEIKILQECMDAITDIINCGKPKCKEDKHKPKLINWKHDYRLSAAPVSRVLGYSVMSAENYTHWFDYCGALNEVGECYWSKIINIRIKRSKGEKLDKNEIELFRNNRDDVLLPTEITEEEREWLNDD